MTKKQTKKKLKKKSKNSFKKQIYKLIKAFFLIGSLVLGILIASIYLGFWGNLPTKKQLTEIRQNKATEVWSEDNKLLGKFYTTDRQPIPFNRFPKHLINALIATEDVRFYEHKGIDKLSMLRVLFKSVLLQNKSSGGGSTLSQQLAKNMFPRRNIGKFGIIIHKTREIIIANRLEEVYSKNELLEHYLNTVPFSDNTFGIESASLKFFNKSAYQLKLEEATVLVGMLKTNYYYNPRLFPLASKKRRNTVLQQMYKYNYISEKVLKKTQNLPLEIDYQNFSHNKGLAPYFREHIKQQIKKWLDVYNKKNKTQLDLFHSGLKIYTTLNAEMQEKAEWSMKKHLASLQKEFEHSYGRSAPWLKPMPKTLVEKSKIYKVLKKQGLSKQQILTKFNKSHNFEVFTWKGKQIIKGTTRDSLSYYSKFLNTGFVSISPQSGQIKTWIGGINFEHFKYDHVSQSKRQVGSTFKPIVYATALENGYTSCDYISNETVIYEDLDNWSPTNASEKENNKKEYSLWAGLAKSLNVISVKLIQAVGIDKTIDMAYNMGITSNLPKVPSLALGTAELSVLELAKAYTSIINGGKYVTPYSITKIEDYQGNILASFNSKIANKSAFSKTTQKQLIQMMQKVTDSGTARRLRWKYHLNNQIASKTGTTQNNKDGWYVGITPKLINICWVGTDNYHLGFKSTRLGQGANSALPIFAQWYKSLSMDSKFDKYTKAKFTNLGTPINCLSSRNPKKNLIEKIFGTKKQKRQYRQEKRKERGTIFKRLFKKRK